MEILSYPVSLVVTVLGLIEPFCKKMKTILIFNLAGNVLAGLSYLLTKSYSGCGICMVAALGLVVNYQFTAKDRPIPKWVVALHAAAFVGVNLFTFAAWFDAFALAASLLFVLSVAQSAPKYYRLLYISNSLCWVVYDLFAGAYANLITHVILSVAIFGAILVRDRKEKKEALLEQPCTKD